MNEEQKEKIKNFLKNNKFAVIATNSSSGYPESAIVGFLGTDEGDIIFRSLSDSRKNQNIKINPKVSLVVLSDNKEWKTLQIEGLARLLTTEEVSMVEDEHCEKNKAYEAYKSNPLNEYFIVEPVLFKYSDLSVAPQEVFEFSNTI
jgi:general stress protein 26